MDVLLIALWAWILVGLGLFVWHRHMGRPQKEWLAEFAGGAVACALILILAVLAMFAL